MGSEKIILEDARIILASGKIIFGGAKLFWDVPKWGYYLGAKRCPTRVHKMFASKMTFYMFRFDQCGLMYFKDFNFGFVANFTEQ